MLGDFPALEILHALERVRPFCGTKKKSKDHMEGGKGH